MTVCHLCASPLSGWATECPNCGAIIAPELPASQPVAPAQPLCLACGASNPEVARFCNQCGAKMQAVPDSPPETDFQPAILIAKLPDLPEMPDAYPAEQADPVVASLSLTAGIPAPEPIATAAPPESVPLPELKPAAIARNGWLWPAAALLLLLFCAGTTLLAGFGLFWFSSPALAGQPNLVAATRTSIPGLSSSARTSTPSFSSPTPRPPTTTSLPSDTPLPLPTDTSRPTQTPTPAGPSGKIVFSCQMNGENRDQVCIVNADGTGWRQLTDNGKHNWYASLSPDGLKVVFSSNLVGDYEIYEVSAFGGAPVRLTSRLGGKLYAPEISPDGRKIVFTYDDNGNQSVWVMNRDGSGPRSLAVGWDPSWSPDGSQVLYASNVSGGAVQLYVMNADGSNQRKVTNLPKLRGRSDWSPLGMIATYAGDFGKRSLWVMNVDGSNAQEYYFNPTSAAPSFSPDGLWMAFTGYLDYPNDLDKGCEIYIVRVGEKNPIRLTDNRYCDWQPRWGP